MLEYIYICRHGFRSNWVDPTIKTGPTGMTRDPPLAAYGVSQAHILADFLSSPEKVAPHPIPQLVFSSPFYRCIQTAQPAFTALSESQTARRKLQQEHREVGRVEVGTAANGDVDEVEDVDGKTNPEATEGISPDHGVMLEHGVQEWYSPVIPETGLHPRPSSPSILAKYFPKGTVNTVYTSTYFPSRHGESLAGLQERADRFVDAWTGRVEVNAPEVRSVVIFAHAASVIALGRALTGNKSLNVVAGCASTSLYRRRSTVGPATPITPPLGNPNSRSTTSLAAADSLLALSGPKSENTSEQGDAPLAAANKQESVRDGEWEIIWNGRADYLERGVERDWSFRDVELKDGEVISDNGDFLPHTEEDTIPTGLAPGMEIYVRRRTVRDRSKI